MSPTTSIPSPVRPSPSWRGPGRRGAGVGAALIATAGLLAGCGGSGSARTAAAAVSSVTTTGTQTVPAVHVSKRLRAEQAALHRQVEASLHHDSDPHARYGTIPADLRHHQRPPANQVLQASAARPARAIQGNGVRLHLAHGTALAVTVGPQVPTRIQGTAILHTSAIWTVTFSDVHGTVPLSAGRFTVTDEQGQLVHPRVAPHGGGPLPATVPTGRPYTIVLRSRVSVGDGTLRYAPNGGLDWIVDWDFDVETD